jgi:hypothetical protein
MQLNRDFVDLFAALNAAGVEYLVVGAHALAAHGHVRATKDLDVWVRPSEHNAKRAYQALEQFGAPLARLSVEDLCTPGVTYQIGVEPVRVDIITDIDGVDFEQAWPARVRSSYGEEPVWILSRQHLIQNKRASGRPQDLADLERLGTGGTTEEV